MGRRSSGKDKQDASVASFRHCADSSVEAAAVDRISLTFRQIQIEDIQGRTAASDDWRTANEAETWEAESYEIGEAGVRRSDADGI